MKSTWISLILALVVVLPALHAYTQAQAQEVEWWEKPAPLELPGRVAGVCYPWLVTEHFLVNLATGETKEGVGGDIALSVDGCGQYFVVRAAFGVYAFSAKTGLMVDAVHLSLSPALRYVGSTGDTIAVLDAANSVVHVKIIGTNVSVLVPVGQPVRNVKYTFIQHVPVAVYSAPATGNTSTYFLANPGKTVNIPVYGTGAVLVHGNRVYVEARGGVLALEITNPIALSYTELFFIPLPIRLTDFISVVGDHLLASSDGIIVRINVNEKSRDFRTAVTVGSVVPTPVGYYVPLAETTYVITETGLYPVPGRAVGRLNNIVFTNVFRRRDEILVPIMWALRPSVLVVTVPLDGMLYDGEYAIKVRLEPGAYRVPRGGVISDGVRNIVLAEPEVMYPPVAVSPEPVKVSNIRFHVSSFPSQYLPLERFSNVEFVASGAGRLLIIQPDKAIVYAGYGVSASIPGTWVYGGVGDCVVLYDGVAYRLYDYGGEPIASYSYYMIRRPDYVTCRRVSVFDYVVEIHVDVYSEKITIVGNEAKVEPNRERRLEDPRGATVYYTTPPRIEYASVIVPVPPDAKDIRLGGLWATWMTAGINILSIPDSTVFVLLSPPANTTAYPINSELFAVYFYEEKRLDILPYKAWFIQNCYVDIETSQEADLYLNDRHVATGSARVYVPCNTRISLEARQIYHRPKRAEVFVVGPTKLTLVPEPMIANVVLNVVAPKGLTLSAVVLRVDGFDTMWNVGEVRRMLAKPTTFEVVQFLPVDVCTKEVYNLTLTEGLNTLTVYCRLVSPVLALTSSVPTTVKLYVAGAIVPSQIVHVTPEMPSYLISPVGDIRLVSEPTVPNYVPKELNVSVLEFRVYELDVTPYPMSKIIVYSNVPTAAITVYNETGGVVATGVGSIEVEVIPGRYTVFAQAPDHAPFSTQVVVPPGEAATVMAVLRRVVIEVPPEKPLWERIEFQVLAIVAVAVAAVIVLWWRRRRARAVAEELVKGEEVA